MGKKTFRVKIFQNLLLIFAILFFLWPIYWMISGSFKNMKVALQIPPEWIPLHPTLENYKTLFLDYPVIRWLFNSVFVSTITAAIVVLISAMAAYALAKIKFKSSKYIFGVMMGAMTLPHTLLFISLFKIISDAELANSYLGIMLPSLGWPFGVFLLKQFMQTLPGALIDSGKIDGCSEFGIFLRIILPLAKPGLGALAIFTFVSSWNDYIWQLIIISDRELFTLPLGIQIAQKMQEFETNYGIAMAGAVLATLPVLVVFLSFQKYFTKGITMGAVKG
jgi:multiple sugar transport system permease protein